MAAGKRRLLQTVRAEHGEFEERDGDDQQIDRPERHRKPDRDDGSEQRARRTPGADEAEEALALLAGEDVGHEGPEHGDREEVEDADPDEEGARDLDRGDVQREEQPEECQVGDEEVIDEGNEARARQARDERAIERLGQEQHDERRGEHPGQVAHAACDAHLVAQRA